ncbi:titin isoform X4 [Drosophila guanche]|uniref:titin isoform X4 n=1 Tax=Drosophila guanche TaxID=7266 RepID=UPI0014709D7E|nr:titin isoform X4 [Drosophila guanche]
MKLFIACIFIAAATAAVIPVEQARHRRDVSEIVNEYVPPAEEVALDAPLGDIAHDSALVGEDGYRYKTVRRLKLRHRRDVSEIANDYLPPSEEVVTEAPLEEAPVEEASQDSAVLAADGYQYKTVRRLKYRQRRDVSEIANEYLPPSEEVATEAAIEEAPVEEASQDSAVLAADGYQYKTVRRLKYRQRRDVSEIANDYLPPSEEVVADEAPVEEVPVEEASQDSAVLADDGYQYKTVRRLKYRQRRDVSEIANEYLPPSEEVVTEAAIEEAPVEEASQDSAVLAADGYQYKTVRRLKYRQRRDVSEIANDYLPPSEEVAAEAPVEEVPVEEASQDSAVLADDGYQYKTVRRLKYRQRRDVSEIANDYLPPPEGVATEAAIEEAPVEEASQDSAVLAADGYQYKTVRRLKYRQRRDVSEIANDYLPPSEEVATEAAIEEAPVEEASQDSAVLAADGYQYKTVRRLKYRQRRDVSEIANDYLPPSEEVAAEAPVEEVPVEEASQDSAVLADDGYQYKTVRRLKYRQRRDVSEIANEYLPPSEEVVTEAAIEEAPVEEASQDSAVLAADGYQYKTVRRLKYRQRRDVSEIANDYLPPSEEVVADEAPVEEVPVEEASQDSAVLADDGYQYKTVRRLKYRQRRDVSEIANDYLPPSEEVATEAAIEEAPVEEASQDSAVLAADGYQYKTVRRLKYRQRRDVSEIANDYLPPSEEVVTEAAIEEAPVEEASQDSAVLAADGYQYKTVRRLKYRQRRDVSEIANDYLPPSEEVAAEAPVEEVPVEEASQDSAVLAADGYQYKTVRRLKYRQRRDVSEIANDYLPPSEEVAAEAPVEEVPVEEASQDSAVLADDGYQYKTVRRLKYRQRRDVSEIANDYLPPSEEVVTEAPVEAVPVEESSQDSAVLAADGYQYKTVRRLKYRQRRDVSEISNDYLPAAEEVVDEAPVEEVAQDSAVLGDAGYQYKTVRRLKLRHRRAL